jgi:arylamine N-acetyltransferase
VHHDDALLARAGARRGAPASYARLAELQRAWCFAQPFHNLDLLAGARRGAPPLDREAALARCAAGLGGPCHVQSWGFLSLLRLVGYEARLCGASISAPDDHLLVHVAIGAAAYLCDVGNGHPYLTPFPLDRVHEQHHVGWHVRSVPDGDELVVSRRSPDQPAWRVVYRASPAARTWEDFAGAIERHHREPGFGPFLSGLRVVRVDPSSMTAVRDAQVITYREGGFDRERLDEAELVDFIAGDLGLAALPVKAAVAAWRDARAARP